MPVNQGDLSFSIGRDCSVVLIHPLAPGGRVDLSNVTGFSAEPEYTNVRSKMLSGAVVSADLPEGYAGSFNIDRGGPEIDDLMVLVEAAWRTAGLIYSATVFQYVTEPSGATSVYQFTECSLQFASLGEWTADAIVQQRITFRANRRLKV